MLGYPVYRCNTFLFRHLLPRKFSSWWLRKSILFFNILEISTCIHTRHEENSNKSANQINKWDQNKFTTANLIIYTITYPSIRLLFVQYLCFSIFLFHIFLTPWSWIKIFSIFALSSHFIDLYSIEFNIQNWNDLLFSAS